jgi:hypothetical protein
MPESARPDVEEGEGRGDERGAKQQEREGKGHDLNQGNSTQVRRIWV